MDERLAKFRVGVMLLATLIIAFILVVVFGDLSWLLRGTYTTVYIAFPQAPGVRVETPVRKSGIRIGYVSEVKLDDEYGVLVTAKIDDQFPLRRNEVGRIGVAILGDAVVEIVPAGDSTLPDEPVQNGDLLIGVVTPDPMQSISNIEGNLSVAIESIARTSDEIGALASNLTDVVGNNKEQLNRIINNSELAVQELRVGINSFNSIVGDEAIQEDLRTSIHKLPQVLGELDSLLSDTRQTVTLVDRNLMNLDRFTSSLGDRGPAIMNNVDRLTTRLDSAIGEISIFAKALNSSEGTFGRMLHDPALYDNVNAAVVNLNTMSRDLQPILRDVRVFTDKIARHPEIIGVRGAIQQSSGIK